MVDLDESIEALISTWLERLEQEGVDPLSEARRIVDEAPAVLRPRLQTQLGELMQMAQTTVQSARLREGGTLGPYRLVRLLGSGATGSVWEVEDAAGARWALKVLHPIFRAADEGVTLLRNELDQRRDLDLPHLVRAHELLDLEGVLAVRCELVGSGRTLAHHVVAARDGEEAHEPRKVLLAILPALRALAVLHDRKVVHGDVKPGNLVLDGAGLCHLSDLGLAQPFHEASRRLHGHALGTPAYLAPELQSNEGSVTGPTAATDVWAAGVLLQEAMTLHRPFESPSLEGLGAAVQPLPPRSIRLPRAHATRGFERDLRSVVARCLQRDPGRRYATAIELVRDLENLAQGRPVVGAPRGMLIRMAFERHRTAALAVGAALVLGIGGTVAAQHYRSLGQRLASEKQGTERANALLDQALAALRSDAIGRETEVQRLLDEMGTLVPADAPGDPLVRASILSQFTFLVSQAPLPNRESLPAIERLCEGALALLPEEHACARADVWIQKALLATRSWRFDRAAESWSEACSELERGLAHEEDADRHRFETVRLAWCRSQLAVAEAELGAVYAAASGQGRVDQLQAELEEAIELAKEAGDEAWALRCELGANQLAWHAGDANPLLAWRAEEVLERMQTLLGRLHPWTLDAHYNAAFATYRAPEHETWESFDELASAPGIPEGRPRTPEEFAARALDLFVELEDLATLALGPRHLLTALAALGHAQQVMLTGDPERAAPLYERALSTLDRVMQPGSEKLRRVSTGYGICLWRAGRLDEALSVLEEQVQLCEAHIETGGANWTTLIARRAMTGVLREQGRLERQAAVFADQWSAARPRLTELALPLLTDLRWAAELQRYLTPDLAGSAEVRARYEEVLSALEEEGLATDPEYAAALADARFAVSRMEAIERQDAGALAEVVAAERERAAGSAKMLLTVTLDSLMGRGSIAGALGDVPAAGRALAEARALGEDATDELLLDLECSCTLAALAAGDPTPARALLQRCRELESAPEARRWIQRQVWRLERALAE